jgi:ubiquinone/menaquinone biosynthesis C-methylase UbiE
MSSKNQVRDLFSFSAMVTKFAAAYQGEAPTTFSDQHLVSRKNFALRLLQNAVPRGSKILEVGCGAGVFTAELMRHGYDVWGIDLSEAMIKYAQETSGIRRFSVGDMENLEFSDNTFDAVTCLGVIEYLERDEAALREMWRVLKPGGRAIISTPNASSPFYLTGRLLDGLMAPARPLYRLVRYRLRGKPQPPKVTNRKYSRRKWLRLLRSMRFEPEEWLCHAWGWYTLDLFFKHGALCRASDLFARNPALNWLGTSQLVCARALKEPGILLPHSFAADLQLST